MYNDQLHSTFEIKDVSDRLDQFLELKKVCYLKDGDNQPF